MKPPIRGLLVDDDMRIMQLISRALDLELQSLDRNVEWHLCTFIAELRRIVAINPPFHFALVEDTLGPGRQLGIAVVEAIRHQSPSSYVVVITGDASIHPDFQERALRAGANAAILRVQLSFSDNSGWSFRSLAERIHRHVVHHQLMDNVALSTSDDDPELAEMLDVIGIEAVGPDPHQSGAEIVRRLAISCLDPGPVEDLPGVELKVKRLGRGEGDRHLLQVAYSAPSTIESWYTLGIGRDRGTVQAMADTLNTATPEHQPVVQHDATSGYSGFAVPMQAGQLATLHNLFSRKFLTPGAAAAIGDKLAGMFPNDVSGRSQTVSVGQWLTVEPFASQRILRTLDLYEPVWNDPDGGNQPDAAIRAERIRRFVKRGLLAGSQPVGNVTYVPAHGDLTTSNVLVSDGPQPDVHVIDFSHFGPAHWASDMIRLTVDAALTIRWSGAGSMMWRDFDQVVTYLNNLHPLTADQLGSTTPVDAFISRLLASLWRPQQGLLDTDNWELHTALAKELVRRASSRSLSAPRAVAAFTSAADHLALAAQIAP